jgi:predicted nicotinamide N-methyase
LASRSTLEPLPAAYIRMLARLRHRIERLFPICDISLVLPDLDQPLLIAQPADPEAPLDALAERQRLSHGIISTPTTAVRFPVCRQRTAATQLSAQALSDGLNAISSPSAGAARDASASIARGEHLPYWALLWPSGMALAGALAADPAAIRGRRTLELGCGLGVTAAEALRRGARLDVVDCFAEALLFCHYNTLRASGREPVARLADWRALSGRAACLAGAPYEVVLAADVLYEEEDMEPLLELVPRLLAPGGECWLAEPGRRASLAFARAAAERGWSDHASVYEREWPPDGKTARITVHRYQVGDTTREVQRFCERSPSR